MNKIFIITNEKYLDYVKYFSLISNSKLLQMSNFKIEKYLKVNSLSKTDLYLENCNHHYYDLFYLDFLSKFFFKKSFIRFKLNLILALHESDYENFTHMVNNTSIIKSLFDICKFTFVLFTSPLWLIYKLFKLKLSN